MPQISGIFEVSEFDDLRISKKDKSYIEFSVVSKDEYISESDNFTPESYRFECIAYNALAKDIFDVINLGNRIYISGILRFERNTRRIIEVTTFKKIIDDGLKENDDENYEDDDFNDDIKF